MSKRRWYPTCLVLLAVAGAACSPERDSQAPLSVGSRLSGDMSGYPKVTAPRTLRFPADHGPHPTYKHEWWYLTGQVETRDRRRFGFQFTIFREAIAPEPRDDASGWSTNQLYLAHIAVTDVDQRAYYSDERFARGAMGLAGAGVAPFRVWLEDWELGGIAGEDEHMRAAVTAAGAGFAFDLKLQSRRPPVAHGDRGMSLKGPDGNASYYYSYTRVGAQGTVTVDDQVLQVQGDAWFDHEWSSSALDANQSGWDWFSLQLSDGADLMLFRLRSRDGTEHDYYSGTLVDPRGRATRLRPEDIKIKPLEHWASDATGVLYPTRWRLSVPKEALKLTTTALIDDQEFAHSFRYWEGAVRVSGTRGDQAVSGRGYVELAGYSPDASR